nr:methyltransferase borM1 [uncultured bacterium]
MTTKMSPDAADTEEPFFDDLAELYERFIHVMDSDRSPVRSWLREQLTGGRRALDLGCGGGRNSVLLAEKYDEVLGVDISQRMLDIAAGTHARPNVRYERRGLSDLAPDTDGVFDVVLAVNALFHMGPAERTLPRVRDLIAPGGKLVVVDVVHDENVDTDAPDWQTPYVFHTAEMVYRISGDADAAADSVRLMLHPTWLAMSRQTVPLRRPEFVRAYADALPGAVFTETLNPTLMGVVWSAPDPSARAV